MAIDLWVEPMGRQLFIRFPYLKRVAVEETIVREPYAVNGGGLWLMAIGTNIFNI